LASTALPALAAVVALVFTWVSVSQNSHQLKLSERGQITDRFNAATTNLGSTSLDMRLGGIYALQGIMEDSPRDEPTVVRILSAFIRTRSTMKAPPKKIPHMLGTDMGEALRVLSTHPSKTPIEMAYAYLSRASLREAHLEYADLRGANLRGADLCGAKLWGAKLQWADLRGVDLDCVDLRGANLAKTKTDRGVSTHSRR
jgi:hypothetical protein